MASYCTIKFGVSRFRAANFGEVSGVDRAGSAELDLAFAQGKQELFVPIEHSPTIPKTQISQGS